MKRLFAAENLTKSFRERLAADNVSLHIGSGEIVGLLGPNGAGKTTVFRMLAGSIAADSGRVLVDGENITRMPMYKRAYRGISYLQQEPSIFRRLTVADNIRAALEGQIKYRRELEERLNFLIDEFRLGPIRSSLGLTLSGGERRRVEIARSLALRPSFILFDEPFAGVDPIFVQEIRDIMESLRDKGLGLLVTDHNVAAALQVCNRSYVIHEGKVIAAGEAEEVLSNKRVRQVYLGKSFGYFGSSEAPF